MQPNNNTIPLQQAIDIARKNPESEFSKKLRQSITSGQLDEAAAKQGVDLSRFGRPKTATTQEDILFGLAVNEAFPNADVGATANTTPTETEVSKPLANKVTEALGLGGATQVFGDVLARQGIGTDTPKEVTQEFIEKPTAGQVAGATLQTAAIPTGFAITGGTSLLGQAAVGAGLGYAYDVGQSLVEQESAGEVLTPGVGTIVGAAAPVAIKGASSLFNAAYGGVTPAATELASQALPETAVTKAVKETPVPGAAQQTVEDVVMRGGRAVQRGREFAESQAEKAARIAAAPEPVKMAIRSNVDDVVIDLTQNADEKTKAIMREMVEMAETPKTGRAAPNPTAKAGDVAVKQYKTITKARQEIGKQIGELSDSLPVAQNIDQVAPVRRLRDTLRQNDIIPYKSGILRFENEAFTDQQQAAIQELYDVATKRNTRSARQVHQLDQRFSAMQRQKQLVDKVGNIFVDTPEGKENIFALFRNTFRNQLDEIAPEFRKLNKQYAQYTNLVENIEGSLIKSKDFSDLVSQDGGVYAEAGLRRMFGEGVNAQANADLYNALDAISRANGYSGARADELYYFGNKLRDIYPETIPETGLRKNISTSIRDVAGDLMDVGKAQPQDQQEAIKALLEMN